MQAASTSAANDGPKAISPTSSPRPALKSRSAAPPSPTWRPLRTSRSTLNSRPRKKRRKISPISATKSVTSDGWTTWTKSGSFGPRMIPAKRYAGIAESPKRLAASPMTPSAPIVTASSESVIPAHSC